MERKRRRLDRGASAAPAALALVAAGRAAHQPVADRVEIAADGGTVDITESVEGLEAQNLTDEQNRLYIDSQRQDTLFETRIGRTFTFGVTYRM